MAVIIVASREAGAGRSLVAAAIAYRMQRDGRAVTLVRLAGDDGADEDASTFASIEGIVVMGAAVAADDVASLSGDIVAEAPAGDVSELVSRLDVKVVEVRAHGEAALDMDAGRRAGVVITRAPASEVAAIAGGHGVTAVLPEDRVLAAPSARDIARAINARRLMTADEARSIDRVMIGTVASDAASPYFGNRERTCVVTRFDKTDIQLAALLTDVACMVLTGGGEPSPYLIDRVTSAREEISLLLARGTTVEVMRAIEPLYGRSRFDGAGKMMRAVELLDEAGVAAFR